jgi:hypothetical protein
MMPPACTLEPGEFVVATDSSFLVGCDFTQCQITGNWVTALVPEPSSLASLASALLAVLLFAGRRSAREEKQVGPRSRFLLQEARLDVGITRRALRALLGMRISI